MFEWIGIGCGLGLSICLWLVLLIENGFMDQVYTRVIIDLVRLVEASFTIVFVTWSVVGIVWFGD